MSDVVSEKLNLIQDVETNLRLDEAPHTHTHCGGKLLVSAKLNPLSEAEIKITCCPDGLPQNPTHLLLFINWLQRPTKTFLLNTLNICLILVTVTNWQDVDDHICHIPRLKQRITVLDSLALFHRTGTIYPTSDK